MNRSKRFPILCFGLVVIVIIAAFLCLLFMPNRWSDVAEYKYVVIQQNETGAEIGNSLYEKGLIRSPMLFRLALRLSGDMSKLQEGYYKLPDNMSLMNLIHQLSTGRVETVKVTIPEGFTVMQIAKRLNEKGIVKEADFLAAAKAFQRPNLNGDVKYGAEGYLFPSTYDIPVHMPAKDIVNMMAREMDRQVTPSMREKMKEKGLSYNQFIILASLVEKEAKFDEDRPIIAAVFLKRLAMGMPLESCASIQYILGYPKPQLSIADTRIPSPYNTYMHKGLPPGPLANPGLKSMMAVLNAPKTDYLFFVADLKGHHHFTKTYAEHEKVVESIYGQ